MAAGVLVLFSTFLVYNMGVDGATYEVQNKTIGSLGIRRLINTLTGEYADIVVDFGGRVEELHLCPNGKQNAPPEQVLLSHNGNDTAIMENAWWKGMFLVPYANRIAYGKYTFYNSTYRLPLNEDSDDPPRLNAMHGLLVGKKLKVVNQSADEFQANIKLSYEFFNEVRGYPFSWLYEVEYSLSKSIGFAVDFTITNMEATRPMPVYIGWHPYFACTAYSSVITFDPSVKWSHVELNSNMNPTGITSSGTPFDGSSPIGGSTSSPTFYDDEYKSVTPPAYNAFIVTKLFDSASGKTVVLSQSPNMRFVHVFSGSMSLFGEQAVAMEPMSGMADAFNNHDHLSILSGGEVWTASIRVNLE